MLHPCTYQARHAVNDYCILVLEDALYTASNTALLFLSFYKTNLKAGSCHTTYQRVPNGISEEHRMDQNTKVHPTVPSWNIISGCSDFKAEFTDRQDELGEMTASIRFVCADRIVMIFS